MITDFFGYMLTLFQRIFWKKEPTQQQREYKRRPIPSEIRDRVWLKYFKGDTFGHCYVCKIGIEKYRGKWHCAHIVPQVKGGQETLDNLVPTCPKCNLSMGTENLLEYKKRKEGKKKKNKK